MNPAQVCHGLVVTTDLFADANNDCGMRHLSGCGAIHVFYFVLYCVDQCEAPLINFCLIIKVPDLCW